MKVILRYLLVGFLSINASVWCSEVVVPDDSDGAGGRSQVRLTQSDSALVVGYRNDRQLSDYCNVTYGSKVTDFFKPLSLSYSSKNKTLTLFTNMLQIPYALSGSRQPEIVQFQHPTSKKVLLTVNFSNDFDHRVPHNQIRFTPK